MILYLHFPHTIFMKWLLIKQMNSFSFTGILSSYFTEIKERTLNKATEYASYL